MEGEGDDAEETENCDLDEEAGDDDLFAHVQKVESAGCLQTTT